MVKTKVWVLIVAALLAVALLLSVLLWVVPHQSGTIAKVYVDGECVYTVDLSKVEIPYQYLIDTPYGTNTLSVEPGRVRIVDATCQGQDCVHQGWISHSGQPIICTPHRLVVQIEGVDDNEVVQ